MKKYNKILVKNVYKKEKDKDMRTKTFLEENKQIKIYETSNGTIIEICNCEQLSYNFNYSNYEFDNVVAMYRNDTLLY